VVESDGTLEAVDSLRTTYRGATTLGYDVFANTLDEVASDIGVRARQMGAHGLSDTCQACSLVDVCGGGYIPHRWSAEHGFANPSVYCADLDVIIRHISRYLQAQVAPALAS
jgi:uncharacterized protein